MIASTFTATGLEVTASILHKLYQTGLKTATDVLETIRHLPAKILSAWNYRIQPQTT